MKWREMEKKKKERDNIKSEARALSMYVIPAALLTTAPLLPLFVCDDGSWQWQRRRGLESRASSQ